jgi:hypothetical protein
MALLAAMSADLGDSHAIDSDGFQSFFHLFQFERLHDRFNLFHNGLLSLKIVAFFTVHTQVETHNLFLVIGTHAYNNIDNL